MSTRIAYTGSRIFDGELWWDRSALVVNGDTIEGIIAADSPTDAKRTSTGGGMLVPGFIDLQVNGGGGVQLNDEPSLAAIRKICATFARFGTTSMLPTFITDTPEQTAKAIAAGIEAAEQRVPGFLGLHLEGPHLSVARKGAHDPALIRPMSDDDLAGLLAARQRLPTLIVTVAAETVTPDQIRRLVKGGVIISVGHSDATYAQVRAAAEAGASVVTHLFNAQSQMGNREPGVVGAALDLGSLSAGLIADGIHVDKASIGVALRAKRGPGHIFLVTDAMSPTGSDLPGFHLNGRYVYRKDGALRLENGTLAGADLTMIDAITFAHRTAEVPLDEVLRMASTYPAEALGQGERRGRLAHGLAADFVQLGDDLSVKRTFIDGAVAWTAEART